MDFLCLVFVIFWIVLMTFAYFRLLLWITLSINTLSEKEGTKAVTGAVPFEKEHFSLFVPKGCISVP